MQRETIVCDLYGWLIFTSCGHVQRVSSLSAHRIIIFPRERVSDNAGTAPRREIAAMGVRGLAFVVVRNNVNDPIIGRATRPVKVRFSQLCDQLLAVKYHISCHDSTTVLYKFSKIKSSLQPGSLYFSKEYLGSKLLVVLTLADRVPSKLSSVTAMKWPPSIPSRNHVTVIFLWSDSMSDSWAFYSFQQ